MPNFQDLETCRNILESVLVGLCVVDVNKRIVFWSDGAQHITGYQRHEVIGHSCIEAPILHCDESAGDACAESCPAAIAIHTAKPAELTCFVQHKSGHRMPLHVQASPVRDAHGSIIGAVETFASARHSSGQSRPEIWKTPACVDEPSGVASRAMMQCHLREAMETFAEMQVPFAVLRIRLEGLDHLRASCGQEAAFALLRVMAGTIEGAFWGTDFVGRWSQEEFLVILNGCSEEALRSVRERIRRMAARASIEWWGERHSLPVTFGAAAVAGDDTIENLLERAERALCQDAERSATASAARHS